MVQVFKFYLPLLVIAALSVFGLFAPVIYSDVYGEILNESPTLYMPMVDTTTVTNDMCSNPTILHYQICEKELTSVA
jgi:hypothetical protein